MAIRFNEDDGGSWDDGVPTLSDEEQTVSGDDYGYNYSGYGFEDSMDYGDERSGYDSDAFLNTDFGGGESQDHDLSVSEALAGQGFFQDELGNAYKLDDSGNLTFKDAKGTDYTYNKEKGGFTDSKGKLAGGDNPLSSYIKKFGEKALDLLKTDGKFDPKKLAGIGLGAYALSKMGDKGSGGYNKPVPKMDVVAGRPIYDDTNRRPGEGGRRYFTNPLFVAQGDAANTQKAAEASAQQANALEAAAPRYAAPAPNPYAGKIPTAFNADAVVRPEPAAGLSAVMTPEQYAEQGMIRMAKGGVADAGRYLQGKTDGMADKIETSIDGEQPALLSHGEFVIPADVVSHLGNGNSEAGADKLYKMMDRIREARTGTKEQGKEINADKFLAAASGGLAAAYAGGGAVMKFEEGGGVPHDTSKKSTLSPWVGDYVTDALGRGAALANAPYQAYQGPLTAGASNLQQQAFAGASDLASAGYKPGSFTGGFGSKQASSYMNPYLQASLDPQLKELQRQSDIQRVNDAGRLTSAGAYGGGRQAIMESEGRRNLLDKQAELLGTGYKTAYDTGLGQFNKEREADEMSRQFSANYGLKSVDQLAKLGEVERGITSEGLAADKQQFEDERDWAYKMPQYQLGLLKGLPIGADTTAVNQDAISKMSSDISGLLALMQKLGLKGK